MIPACTGFKTDDDLHDEQQDDKPPDLSRTPRGLEITTANTAKDNLALATLSPARHIPCYTAMPRSIGHRGSRNDNRLTHPTALVTGPAGDTRPLPDMDPREEFDLNNDGLYRDPAKLFSGYCQGSRVQEQQKETRAGKGKPPCQMAGLEPLPR